MVVAGSIQPRRTGNLHSPVRVHIRSFRRNELSIAERCEAAQGAARAELSVFDEEIAGAADCRKTGSARIAAPSHFPSALACQLPLNSDEAWQRSFHGPTSDD
jgi:hypothetical protein